jgi:hypothetical protein
MRIHLARLLGAILIGGVVLAMVSPGHAEKKKALDAANDPDQSRFDDPSMGRYMLRSSVLIGLELKRGWGSNGWGRTDFAKAFHLSSDNDFLNNEEAQEGAISTLLAYQEVALAPVLERYGGKTFRGISGARVKVTQSGVMAAGQRAGAAAVLAYFKAFGGHDTQGKADFMPARFRQVELRLQKFQDIPYGDQPDAPKSSTAGRKK